MISQNTSAIGHGHNKTLSKNLFYTYFAIEWNPRKKIEIKQSTLNLFCNNYSTFSLIK